MNPTTTDLPKLALPLAVALAAGTLLIAASTTSGSTPASLNAAAQQEANPFAPKPPKARQLPSILERDEQGRVVWLEGDPGRYAIELIGLSDRVASEVGEILEERNRLLVQAAIVNADKIVRAFQAERSGNEAQYDEVARAFSASLGELTRRNTIHNDSEVRETLGRVKREDLSTVVREYNLARAREEQAEMEAEAAARGEELSEFVLRESTILQRFIARDMVADGARMLEARLGGAEALLSRHQGLRQTLEAEGYWAAMAELTSAQLAAFIVERTGVEVRFPSPEGDASLVPLIGSPALEGPADPSGQG